MIRISRDSRNILMILLGLPASARIYPKDLSGGPQEYEALLDVNPWPKNMLCFGFVFTFISLPESSFLP